MKKKENSGITQTIVVAIVFGALAGSIAAYTVSNNNAPAERSFEELAQEFYDVETAVHISPHGMRKHMGEDENVVIVDLRSQEEYEEEHIITAINIPAYKDRDHSDYGAVERIVSQFSEIPKGKEIIVYCYSTPCMTGRKVGKILADNGIYVKHLGIGWNEWRYDWTSWNHAHEWEQTNVEDYIWSGPEPGVLDKDLTGSGCPIEGGLGC